MKEVCLVIVDTPHSSCHIDRLFVIVLQGQEDLEVERLQELREVGKKGNRQDVELFASL